MANLVRRDTARRRFVLQLTAVFSGLAAALAGLGLYGVMAAAVQQRTREIGLHMAIGAGSADVLRRVLADGARLTVPGLAGGIALAAAVTGYLESQIFGIRPWDPLVLLTTPLAPCLLSLPATLVPAWRASCVDPIAALREP